LLEFSTYSPLLSIIHSQNIIQHSFDTKSRHQIRVSTRLKGIHSSYAMQIPLPNSQLRFSVF
jgi:hypothetical protein